MKNLRTQTKTLTTNLRKQRRSMNSMMNHYCYYLLKMLSLNWMTNQKTLNLLKTFLMLLNSKKMNHSRLKTTLMTMMNCLSMNQM